MHVHLCFCEWKHLGGHKGHQVALGLDLIGKCELPVWVLETKLGSFARAASGCY